VQEGIHVVRNKQNRRLRPLLHLLDAFDEQGLIFRVEAGQWLVQDENPGRPSNACASMMRCLSPPESSEKGTVGIPDRIGQLQDACDFGARRPARSTEYPAFAWKTASSSARALSAVASNPAFDCGM